jgi:predicted transcriptional regulator
LNGNRRRDHTEISYDILKAALNGEKKTRLMYQSRLNVRQLNEYLEQLTLCELVCYPQAERHYATTEKGRAYTKMFENYKETADLLTERRKALAHFFAPNVDKPMLVPAKAFSW